MFTAGADVLSCYKSDRLRFLLLGNLSLCAYAYQRISGFMLSTYVKRRTRMFKRINVKEWRQFSDIDIEFHQHLTVLTGANGAGKTTVLNLLSKSIGWNPQFVSSYEEDENGIVKYFNSLKDIGKKLFIKVFNASTEEMLQEKNKLGELEFYDGTIADLVLPNNVADGTYGINVNGGKMERGVYVNSHRPNFPYKAVKTIPTSVATRTQIYNKYNEFNKTFVFDTFRNANEVSATSLIKETLASLAIFGYGNKSVVPNETARKLFETIYKKHIGLI